MQSFLEYAEAFKLEREILWWKWRWYFILDL
jgi:hypothetical protein